MMKVLLALCLCLAPGVFSRGDNGWTSQEYPDPMSNLDLCNRRGQKESHICDPDGVLSLNNANQLDIELKKVTEETDCQCGDQCAVSRKGFVMGLAVMKKMTPTKDKKIQEMIDKASGSERAFLKLDASMQQANQFAYDLLNKWQLGRCGDDLILIYSKEDNVLFTFTGEQTQKSLKPSAIAEITLRHRIHIGPNRNTLEGIKGIISDFKAELNGKYERETNDRYTAAAAALRSRRHDNSAGHTTTAVLVTTIASILASLSLH